MKRFAFSLDRVLDFRRQQEEMELGRLQALAAEQARFEHRAADLLAESRQVRNSCLAAAALPASELRQTQDYAAALRRSREHALASARALEDRRGGQLARVLEARRRVRLLEMLRRRRGAAHNRLADREREALTAELHLARLQREKPNPL